MRTDISLLAAALQPVDISVQRLPEVKRPRSDTNHWPAASADRKERMELYLHKKVIPYSGL